MKVRRCPVDWFKPQLTVIPAATSSVDYETDAKITATIKESFSGVTLIVIGG